MMEFSSNLALTMTFLRAKDLQNRGISDLKFTVLKLMWKAEKTVNNFQDSLMRRTEF